MKLRHIQSPYLECHEQTFSLDVGEAEVDTARVSVDVTVADDVLHLGCESLDQPVRQLGYDGMVSLRKQCQRGGPL